MVEALPTTLVISGPSFKTLAVLGLAHCPCVGLEPPGTPPPAYRYPVPSSSTKTAGSNSHTTPDIPGVFGVTSAFPIGSVHGPIGESAVRTPIPPPLFAK